MATHYDPFHELDRMLSSLVGSDRASAVMPMDLYRSGDHYVLAIDLPGVEPGTIDVNVEDRTLTIRAQRAVALGGGRSVAGQGAADWHVRSAAHRRPRTGARCDRRELHRRRAHAEHPGGRRGKAAPDRSPALEPGTGNLSLTRDDGAPPPGRAVIVIARGTMRWFPGRPHDPLHPAASSRDLHAANPTGSAPRCRRWLSTSPSSHLAGGVSRAHVRWRRCSGSAVGASTGYRSARSRRTAHQSTRSPALVPLLPGPPHGHARVWGGGASPRPAGPCRLSGM